MDDEGRVHRASARRGEGHRDRARSEAWIDARDDLAAARRRRTGTSTTERERVRGRARAMYAFVDDG